MELGFGFGIKLAALKKNLNWIEDIFGISAFAQMILIFGISVADEKVKKKMCHLTSMMILLIQKTTQKIYSILIENWMDDSSKPFPED